MWRSVTALRGDRRLALKAVAQDGRALRHCAPALRRDRGVCAAAVARDPRAWEFVAGADALRGDAAFAEEVAALSLE